MEYACAVIKRIACSITHNRDAADINITILDTTYQKERQYTEAD
jgi:hypothetical protein